jgi:hypothetical protein
MEEFDNRVQATLLVSMLMLLKSGDEGRDFPANGLAIVESFYRYVESEFENAAGLYNGFEDANLGRLLPACIEIQFYGQ